jgi:hypothetical protein
LQKASAWLKYDLITDQSNSRKVRAVFPQELRQNKVLEQFAGSVAR